MLPHVSGLELIEIIRRKPGWQQVPDVMLTVRADDEDIKRAMELGANDYITKPFDPDELITRLRGQL